jgi:hypothetical protein
MPDLRLPRRGLFGVLATLPLTLFGWLGRRNAEVAPAPAAAAEPEVEAVEPMVAQLARHTERMQQTLDESLHVQLAALQDQNRALAESHDKLLKLQQDLLSSQALRERAAKAPESS